MVVSNDYYKAARQRAAVSTNLVDSNSLLDRCFYDLVRGPSLFDDGSPLRGHSILADQYGYGFKAAAAPLGTANFAPTGSFVDIFINASPDPNGLQRFVEVLRPIPPAGSYFDPEIDPEYVDGGYGGRVLSITSGALKGFTGRIIHNVFEEGADAASKLDNRIRFRLLDDGTDWSLLQTSDQILINGREFSGVGAGDSTGLVISDPDSEGSLGANVLQPNRVGDVFDPANAATGTLNEATMGYLGVDRSVNEPHDALDYHNMFLGGILPSAGAGTIIPSFHRDTLYSHQFSALGGGASIRRYSFRPVFDLNSGVVPPRP